MARASQIYNAAQMCSCQSTPEVTILFKIAILSSYKDLIWRFLRKIYGIFWYLLVRQIITDCIRHKPPFLVHIVSKTSICIFSTFVVD